MFAPLNKLQTSTSLWFHTMESDFAPILLLNLVSPLFFHNDRTSWKIRSKYVIFNGWWSINHFSSPFLVIICRPAFLVQPLHPPSCLCAHFTRRHASIRHLCPCVCLALGLCWCLSSATHHLENCIVFFILWFTLYIISVNNTSLPFFFSFYCSFTFFFFSDWL